MTDKNELRIAVCEDSAKDAALLKSFIAQSGIDAKCRFFPSGEALLSEFRANAYELIFMDIYMEGIQGTEAAKIIRAKDKNVMIAFSTTSLDHTLESYRMGALKYLEKPLTAECVKETLEIALLKQKSRNFISFTAAGGKPVKVLQDNILYLEQKGHVIEIHTPEGILITSQSVKMAYMEANLPSPPFFRCHRSFIVNFNYVEKVSRQLKAFLMENGGRADIRRGSVLHYENLLDQWRLSQAGSMEL